MARKKASKKVVTVKKAAAPKRSVPVPRGNVGATVQAMIAGGATRVLAEEETAETWVVTQLE
jgi:hypothetical protein